MSEVNYTKELQAEAEKVQAECHEMIKGIMIESPHLSYQDATNVFLFAKLAQQGLKIDMLKDKIKSQASLIDKIKRLAENLSAHRVGGRTP